MTIDPSASESAVPASSLAIPDHTLLHRIGSGSYGEVWLACNAIGTLRAVKIVRRASFKDERPYEREFSGMLKFEPVSRSHEGLMDILQIGRNEEAGYFYYVMELADDAKVSIQEPLAESEPSSRVISEPLASRTGGLSVPLYRPLTLSVERAIRGQLPLSDCVRHFSTLASGLAALHQAGLIHRDIKPSNLIIVGGVAKLADIGLVADMDETHSFVGTEGFIPPEGPGTAQADLYSLGKVLYEVATGKDRKEYPSLPLGPDSKNPPQDLLELNAIISRSCAADLSERYANAMEMHADLAVLQAGRSVRSLHAFESRLRSAKRVGLVAAVIAVLAVGALALASWTARVERDSRARTEAALRRAEAAEHDAREKLYDSLLVGAVAERRSDLMGRRFRALDRILQAAQLHPGAVELRDAAISALALVDMRETRRFPLPPGAVGQGFSANLEMRLIADTNGTVHARRITDDLELFAFPGQAARRVALSPYDPDGRWLAVDRDNGPVEWWNLKGRRLEPRFQDFVLARISQDQRHQAGFGADQQLLFLDLVTGERRDFGSTFGRVKIVEFVGDATVAVVAYPSPDIRLIDWVTGQVAHTLHPPNGELPTSIQANPDGSTLAVGFGTGEVAFYRTRDLMAPFAVVMAHDSRVGWLRFHPDGDWCLTTSWDGTTRILGASEGQAVSLLRAGNSFHVFTADGRHAGGYDTTGKSLVLYDCAGREACRVLSESMPSDRNQVGPWNGTFSPDGRLLASASYDGLRLYETHFGREVAHFSGRAWYSVAFAGSTNLYSAGENGLARWPLTWRGSNDVLVGQREYVESKYQWHMQASRDGAVVASADARGRLVLRCSDGTRKEIVHGTEARGVYLSPDGRRVAASSSVPPTTAVWDTRTGALLRKFPLQASSAVAFSPEGARLAVNDVEGVMVWDVETGRELWRTPLTRGGLPIVWSPDGRVVAALRENMVPVLLDAATGQVLARLEHPDLRLVNALAFSPDSGQLACFSTSHRIHLWNLRTLRRELAAMSLDWDLPVLEPSSPGPPLRVEVDAISKP